MSTTYAKSQTTAQKKDAPTAASVLDNSSQSESLQRKADMANNASQRAEAPRPNNTGMPDNLKAGIESLSGFSMDDVRVHYNSSKPATVQALAYTQGTDIHVAPGQEKHLPHEAWHVAQQMAGRVSPTTNINGMPVNDNAALEHEADVMGEKAAQCKEDVNRTSIPKIISSNTGSVQRMPTKEDVENDLKGIATLTFPHDPLVNNHDTIIVNINEEFNELILDTNAINSNKINALKKMSEVTGRLGALTENMIQHEIFYANILCHYKTRGQHDVTLSVLFECTRDDIMGKRGPGFITKVCKSQKGGREPPLTATIDSRENDAIRESKSKTYSKNHDRGKKRRNIGVNIFNLTYRTEDRPYFNAEIPDAYTILIAEGARFMCVRNNMEKIKYNSFIYVEGENKGIYFRDLWKQWGVFKKSYNIDDDTIAKAICNKSSEHIKEDKKLKNVINASTIDDSKDIKISKQDDKSRLDTPTEDSATPSGLLTTDYYLSGAKSQDDKSRLDTSKEGAGTPSGLPITDYYLSGPKSQDDKSLKTEDGKATRKLKWADIHTPVSTAFNYRLSGDGHTATNEFARKRQRPDDILIDDAETTLALEEEKRKLTERIKKIDLLLVEQKKRRKSR